MVVIAVVTVRMDNNRRRKTTDCNHSRRTVKRRFEVTQSDNNVHALSMSAELSEYRKRELDDEEEELRRQLEIVQRRREQVETYQQEMKNVENVASRVRSAKKTAEDLGEKIPCCQTCRVTTSFSDSEMFLPQCCHWLCRHCFLRRCWLACDLESLECACGKCGKIATYYFYSNNHFFSGGIESDPSDQHRHVISGDYRTD